MVRAFEKMVRRLTSDRKFSEILTGSIFAMAARAAAVAFAMLANIVIARFYGAQAMGILAMVNSFLFLITIFTVLGTGTSILRLIPEHIARHSVTSAFRVYRKTQYVVAAVSVVSGTAFFFASGIVADKVFSKPHLSFFFALAAGFVAFKSLMDLNSQAVRGLRLIRTFAFMQLLPSLAMLVVLIAGTLLFRHPNNPVYSQLAAYAVTAMVGALIMDHAFKKGMRTDDVVKPLAVPEILSMSMPMLMSASMYFFTSQTGVIMLGMFRTESEVGYYSVASKLANLTAFVLQAINTMAAPKFSELYHTDKMDELFHVARKSSKLIFWTTAPILITLVLLGRPLLGLFFGGDFIVAYVTLIMLAIGQLVNSISGSTGYFMNMTGHQNAFRNIMFCSALINIALSLALIPRFGMNGAAFAGMVSLASWNIYTLIYIRIKFGRTIGYVPLFWRSPAK